MSKESGELIDYREFCEMIIDPYEWAWFYQPIDFYKMIASKRKDGFPEIKSSLEALLGILGRFKHPYGK